MSRAIAKRNPRSSQSHGREANPAVSTTALIVGGVILAAGVTVGVFLWRRSGTEPGAAPQDDGIRAQLQAIVDQQGGAITASEATDILYAQLDPDCPEVLDPDNQEHVECMEDWLDIYAVALEIVGDPLRPSSGSGGGSGRPLTDSERVLHLFGALSNTQKNDLRMIFGPQLLEQLEQAAQANQDMQVRQILGKMKAELDAYEGVDELVALTSITISLGPLADEFAWLLNK